ncbi:uncharacterized protein LOC134535296 [Bacillus rossius redtenbacheri]|uniref:uncharacterized protein LOC134535296 n=1 Tax=Bacillus rossius redtenbacheri TaxID=93214 RepID=UPI002FDDDF69
MKTCCFGLSLRAGCVTVGLLNLTPLIMAFVGIPIKMMTSKLSKPTNTTLVVIMVLVTLIYLPANILLLIGVSDKKSTLLLIWLFVYALTWTAEVIFFIYKISQGLDTVDKLFVLLGLILIAITSHMMVVVYSHCKDLKRDEAEARCKSRPAPSQTHLHRRVSTNSVRLKPVAHPVDLRELSSPEQEV